jgi:hypothetical protein
VRVTKPRRRFDAMPPPAPEVAPQQPCVFCAEGPVEARGHEGLAEEVARNKGVRTYLIVSCTFCGIKWARRRSRGPAYEWLRVAE